jgi:sec-independent protein translocase protein TatA
MGAAGRRRGAPRVKSERKEQPVNLGLPEFLVILLILLLVFGANRLPELARGLGKGIKNFKEAVRGDGKS